MVLFDPIQILHATKLLQFGLLGELKVKKDIPVHWKLMIEGTGKDYGYSNVRVQLRIGANVQISKIPDTYHDLFI